MDNSGVTARSFIFYLFILIHIFAVPKGNGVLPYPTALQKLMTPD